MITVRDVLEALATPDAARAEVMARFRERGGSLDRWRRSDVRAMADALSWTEDALELVTHGRMTPARAGLKKLRRLLEDELNASAHPRTLRHGCVVRPFVVGSEHRA
jgi:hypothetical protein